MDSNSTETNSSSNKITIEDLSKDEIIAKYKSLLNIAKKAKQAKDESAEENRRLKEIVSQSETQKEADKKALITMKEMLEQFTEDKLKLTIKLSEMEQQTRSQNDKLTQLNIENESLKRQLERLADENESLLRDIDKMEDQLQQVNRIGMEQRKHITLLEPELNKLKECESQVVSLQSQVEVLKAQQQAEKEQMQQMYELLEGKYCKVKEINSEQCKKFNYLKERFMDVHGKLKRLKECRCSLLETQQEYYEHVSKWQKDIQKASQMICSQFDQLSKENAALKARVTSPRDLNQFVSSLSSKLKEMLELSTKVMLEYEEQAGQWEKTVQEHENAAQTSNNLMNLQIQQELKDLKEIFKESDKKLKDLKEEKAELERHLNALQKENLLLNEENQKLKDSLRHEKVNKMEASHDLVDLSEAPRAEEAALLGLKEENLKLKEALIELQHQVTAREAAAAAATPSPLPSRQLNETQINQDLISLENNFQELQQQLADLEKENEQLKVNEVLLQEDNEKLQLQLNESQKAMETLKQASGKSDKEIQMLVVKETKGIDEVKEQQEESQEELHEQSSEALAESLKDLDLEHLKSILVEENSVLKSSLKKIESEETLLKAEIEDLRSSLKQIESEDSLLRQENLELIHLKESSKAKESELMSEIEDFKVNLHKLQEEKLKILQDHEKLIKENSSFRQIQEDFARLSVKEAELQEENRKYKTEIEDLSCSLAKLKEDSAQVCLDLTKQTAISQKLQEQITRLEVEKRQMAKQMDDSLESHNQNKDELQSLKQSYADIEVLYASKEREHADLLDEMRELNEVLKARGDVISRQQERQQELSNELKNLTAQVKQYKQRSQDLVNDLERLTQDNEERLQQITKLLKESEEKDQKLEQLNQAIEELQRKLKEKEEKQSKTAKAVKDLKEEDQELVRLKEETRKQKQVIENSEENLKEAQKKGGQEATPEDEASASQQENLKLRQEIEALKALIAKLENDLQASVNNFETVRNSSSQIIQSSDLASAAVVASSEADNQSEVISVASNFSKADELLRLRDLEDSFEDKYNKMRALALKLKKKLQDQTLQLAENEKQLNHQDDLQNDHKAKQQQLQKQIDQLKQENQKLKSSRKQTNVLNLEIEAAEKSLSELNSKLLSKSQETEALKATVSSQETSMLQLKEQIHLLELAKQSEIQHSKDLKQQIDLLQSQIKDVLHEKQQTLSASKDLQQSLDALKLENEEFQLKLSGNSSHYEEALAVLQQEKQKLSKQFQEDQLVIKNLQQSLAESQRNLEAVRLEFKDYKVKAQAVLRKNQSKDSVKEKELAEELILLKASEEKSNALAKEYIQKIEASDQQIATLNSANSHLEKRTKDLAEIIEDLRQQYEALSLENQKLLQLQQESLKQHREQIEQINSCHKLQAQELEAKYHEEILHLKAELTKFQANAQASSSNTSASLAAGLNGAPLKLTTDQSKIDFLLMEREDAEGSEEAIDALASKRKISNTSRPPLNSLSSSSNHDFMPLDELLNAPMHLINDSVITTTTLMSEKSFTVNGDETSAEALNSELNATKERLQIQESRVKHLTALLSENEQDLAKLTQMNDMLKEELRRQERSAEREKHMHNAEYLKNVILKFLTLNNADEKVRLVPVINTILRLSKTEAEMLNSVAKGQKINSERSWSSLLSSWTGGNTGHYPNFSNTPPSNNNNNNNN